MAEIITSPQNPRIKAAAKLRDRRGRKQTGRMIVDGQREIAQALLSNVVVRELFYCADMLESSRSASVLSDARKQGVEVVEVNEAVFQKLMYGRRADGVVAVADRPRRGLSEIELGGHPLVAVIEHVEKPGNLGAILRSADAAGVDAVVVVDPATDTYGPNVIRASLGAIFGLNVAEAESGESIEWLKHHRFQIIAATPDSAKAYSDVDYRAPTAIVFGSEAGGVSEVWDRIEIVRASIPMLGRVDSLNVSATAALFFYEALRQRRATGRNPL